MQWTYRIAVICLALYSSVQSSWGQQRQSDLQNPAPLLRQALQLLQQGRYPESARLGEQALAILQQTVEPQHPRLIRALNNLGEAYRHMGQYAQAIQLYQRALTITEQAQGATQWEVAATLNNLALAHRAGGNYGEALLLAQRARTIAEKVRGQHHPETIPFLHNLAGLYYDTGNENQAVVLFLQALDIQEKTFGEDHPQTAYILRSLAEVFRYIKEYDKALEFAQRALTIQAKTFGPEHPETVKASEILAWVHESLGHEAKALALLQQVLSRREQLLGLEHPEITKTLHRLAGLSRSVGHPVAALQLFQRALAIQERALGPHHPQTTQVLSELAGVYNELAEYGQAFALYQRVSEAQLSFLTQAFLSTSEEQKLLFTDQMRNTTQAAVGLVHRHFQTDPAAVRFALELVLRHKGIVQEAQSHVFQILGATLEGDILASWQRRSQHLSTLSGMLLRGPGAQSHLDYQLRLLELIAAITQEEQLLSQHSSRGAAPLARQILTVQKLAERLPPGTALIEFVRLEERNPVNKQPTNPPRYLAFVLTPDAGIRLVDLGEAMFIDVMVTTTLAHLKGSIRAPDVREATRQVDAALTNVSQQLFRPLEGFLPGISRLIMSPDSLLNLVPFAALITSESHYLVEKFTLVYMTSGGDLLRSHRHVSPTMDLLLVANPAFDDTTVFPIAALPAVPGQATQVPGPFTALPGTTEEARSIPPLIQGTRKRVLEGSQATEAAVRAAITPRILHLATHGFFLQDQKPLPHSMPRSIASSGSTARDLLLVASPTTLSTGGSSLPTRVQAGVTAGFSGLVLAGANNAALATTGDDGLLTHLEVASMSLHGTDAVILSACETAVGETVNGEGVYGLRRAFALAGARHLVMSLWPVEDQATARQMQRFYQGYEQGMPIPDALRQAQLQTIAALRVQTQQTLGEALAPVYLWAPFIVQKTGSIEETQ